MVNMSGALDLTGVTLRFADLPGADPTVVFLHGAGADHVMFEQQAAAIQAAGRRVVLVDLRGHGASRPTSQAPTAERFVDDIDALVEHLGVDRPVLVGHSLGGNIAQALVRRHPQRFAALVVVDSTWNAGPLTRTERSLLRLAAPGLALIPAKRLPRVMANASAVTDAARADAVRAFSQLTKAEFIAVWRATVEFVRPEPATRTPIPLLLIRGVDDTTGNIATAMPAWAEAEGIREHVIADAGHLVTQDAPDAVSAVLVDFLEKL